MFNNCVYCGNVVAWDAVMETTAGRHAAFRVSTFGLRSLTDHEQYIYKGRVCAPCCDEPVVCYEIKREQDATSLARLGRLYLTCAIANGDVYRH